MDHQYHGPVHTQGPPTGPPPSFNGTAYNAMPQPAGGGKGLMNSSPPVVQNGPPPPPTGYWGPYGDQRSQQVPPPTEPSGHVYPVRPPPTGQATMYRGPTIGGGPALATISQPIGPPRGMSGPPQGMSGPLQGMSGPPQGMSGPLQGMSGPPQGMSGPPQGMSGPPQGMSGPLQGMSGPPQGMSGPLQGMSGPPQGMSGPPPSFRGPAMGHSNMAPPTSRGPPMGPPPASINHPMEPPPGNFSQSFGPPTSHQGLPIAPPTGLPTYQGLPMAPPNGPPTYQGPPMVPPTGPPTYQGPPMVPPTGPPTYQGPPMGPPTYQGPPMAPSTGPPTYLGGGRGGPPPPPSSQMAAMNLQSQAPPLPGSSGTYPGPQGGYYPPPHQQQNFPGYQSTEGLYAGDPQGDTPTNMAQGIEFPKGQPASRGTGQPPSPGTGQFTYGQTPVTQGRRLDPDQMPSPIQVIEADRQSTRTNYTGRFQCTQPGLVPPLVTSDEEYVTEDYGYAAPTFVRSTMYSAPCSSDLLKSTHIPFALCIQPLARRRNDQRPLPVVDLGPTGPVRCTRCKAYMCPFMTFIEGGRRFKCAFCGGTTEVPSEYFQHLDQVGRRVDYYERPELSLGAYEIMATLDYCKDGQPPQAPSFIFMIDVSYNSIKNGLVDTLCAHLKDVLYNLPREHDDVPVSELRVAFVTYAKDLHFYNVKGSLSQPQMLVVSDVSDVFVPLLDGFFVRLNEAETVIDSLLAQIPVMFKNTQETETVLGPVIQAGLDALKSARRPGKLFIFHTTLPQAIEAPGKLKNRDDNKLLGTDKEKTLLTPQTNFYTKLGQLCVEAGCSVDLFLFPNSYIDVATIAEVPRLTGGAVYYYRYFNASVDGDRLIDDLKRNVSKPIAFDAILRVRTSTGVRPVDFLGNFHMSNTTDVELASLDCDKAIIVEIKHDDKLPANSTIYAQTALLFTSVSGHRKLRVLNSAFNVCSELADLFKNCELDIIINYMAKIAIRDSLNTTPKQVREALATQCAQILACYRAKCAAPSSAGQLILPECMKLMPLYVNCITKSAIFQVSGEISTDDRSLKMFQVNSMPVQSSQVYFYPRLIPLHNLDVDVTTLPTPIRASYERLQDSGAYLAENGFLMALWIGLNVSTKWVQDVFGVQSAAQIDIDAVGLHDLDNPLSRRVRGIIQSIRDERPNSLKLLIVRQRDKLEPLFLQLLIEDRSVTGAASYVDYLCHIHKEIRSILS